MAKPNRNLPARTSRILVSNLFNDTLDNFRSNTVVLQSVRDFFVHKRATPLEPFGGKDYPFRHGDLRGIRHAGLTQDISIVYTMSGKNPIDIALYGIFSHTQLGTSHTPDHKRQSRVATTIRNQTDLRPYEPIDESVRR